MTGKDLLVGLSCIDERFIDEAEHSRPSMAFPWLRIASLAACLCLILLCVQPLMSAPQGTTPPTTLPHYLPEGFPEVVVYVQEMTDDGFTGTVAELVMPGLFELGAELKVVFEADAWFEKADGTSGTVAEQRPDFSGCYVLVICTECGQNAATITVDTIWEVPPPEHAPQKG
ncbi:MAG: hypothetical protein E7451_01555 [Ruminococcaceae bacterium]|nr:hypothetical protein [Oscillospiraceae bacterium]